MVIARSDKDEAISFFFAMTNQFNCEERSSLSVIASLTALAVRLAISFLAIEKGLKAIFPGLLTL